MRTRTLTQLRDGVADRADVDVAASGVRHTHTLIDARINRAVQRWRNLMAGAGDDTHLAVATTTTSTSSTADANGWEPREYIALPATYAFIRSIDLVDGDEHVELMPVEEAERNYTERLWDTDAAMGQPAFYRIGGTNEAGSNIARIFPKAGAVYTIKIRYIPAHTDLSSAGDTVDFVFGGEEWVINDAAYQTLRADGLAGSPEAQAMLVENKNLEKDLAFQLACRTGGPRRKVRTHETRLWLKRRVQRGDV